MMHLDSHLTFSPLNDSIYMYSTGDKKNESTAISRCISIEVLLFCGDLHAVVLLKVTTAHLAWHHSDEHLHADYSIIFNPLNPPPPHMQHASGALLNLYLKSINDDKPRPWAAESTNNGWRWSWYESICRNGNERLVYLYGLSALFKTATAH